MVLKSFEIQGFKSFPDKTALQFGNGVTTVVGPNGSGKSNIAEAVRWVLGEQNARVLRCDKKMEELIFHGTQNRGPVGLCEATIKLDNSSGLFPLEQDEVAITRRLYRSGESEYYINKAAVRLKDVLDLFLGTGLSRDGYAIIGQGRIGEILSEKSADRRRVFEEAAGISRYRARKEDAERKLQHAEDNLTRIRDKIDELSLQRDPLKEQAELARRFLLLRDEHRGLEINVWLHNLDKARADAEKARRDHEDVLCQLGESKTRLEFQYAMSETLSVRHAEQQRAVEDVRTELAQNDQNVAELEGKGAVVSANIGFCEQHIERINQELEGASGRAVSLSAQVEARREQIAALDVKLSGIAGELDAALRETQERAGRSGDLEAQLADCAREESEAAANAASRKDELSTLGAVAEEMSARRQTVMTDMAERAATQKYNDGELERVGAELKKENERTASLQNVIEGYRIRLGARRSKAEELRETYQKCDRRIEALAERVKMLEDMEREYEGFPRAVKSVMQESARGALGGVVGTVSERIRSEDRYTTAIETALGTALQNIIVEDEQDAKTCIQYLKSRNIGRATFLPLSSVRGRADNVDGWKNEPGFVGLASDLVGYDERVEGAVLHLLGRTLVAVTLDDAINIARKSGNRVRIVTLDGQIISAGGAMTGGSEARGVGTLSRRNELERLRGQGAGIESEREEASKALKDAERELSAAQYELDVAAEERRAAELSMSTLRAELNHKRLWQEQAQAAIDALRGELSSLNERIDSHNRRMEILNAEIEAFEKAREEKRKLSDGLTRQIDELVGCHEDLSARVQSAREAQAALTAERLEAERAVAEYMEYQEELSGDRDAKLGAIRGHQEKKAELEGELSELKARIDAASEARADIQGRLTEAINASLEIEAERGRCDKRNRETNDANLRLQHEADRLEGRRAMAENEETQILDRFRETYGLTHQDALRQRTVLSSVNAAQKRIAELKREIAALGDVNVGAIDEYSRLNERYEYLTEQSGDAGKAKDELLGILEEITTAMKDIFAEKFESINNRFSETFLEIFGGGQAYLELEQPDDLLNTGIEIKVRPPGKKLSSLSPLSGGERSLVAIALYFAIFKVNPAPFCVLDEVDHDLDDVNVTRYADYLMRMSKTLQFVVITHRRGTMEAADYLYGVTSEQQGVSKILELDIAEVERELGLKLS